MSESFIVRRGGGGISDAFAVIAVSYPAGSTCTCTHGSKVLKAKDTSGSYLFMLPEAGDWTVTATDGQKTASKTIVIAERYQVESVTLTYELTLIENGIVNPEYSLNPASNFTQQDSNVQLLTGNGKTVLGYLAPIVDVAAYNKLHIEGRYRGGTTATYFIGIKSDTVENTDFIVNSNGRYTSTISELAIDLDISEVSDPSYFALYTKAGSQSSCYFYLTEVVFS